MIALVEGEHRVDGKTVPAIRTSPRCAPTRARRVAAPAQGSREWRVHRRQARARALRRAAAARVGRRGARLPRGGAVRGAAPALLRVGAKCDARRRRAARRVAMLLARRARRRRGRAGGPATTLTSLWHATEAATAAVARLRDPRPARGLLVPGDDGVGDQRRPAPRRRVGAAAAGGRGRQCIFRRKHCAARVRHRNAAWKEHVTQLHGKNLQGDWHDKLFGSGSSRAAASTAGHHRRRAAGGGRSRAHLDEVAHPNRLTRLRAVHLGLTRPHGFTAKEGTFVLDARREPPAVTLPALGVVPYVCRGGGHPECWRALTSLRLYDPRIGTHE